MAKRISEHEALRTVDELMNQLTKEERQRVFDWISMKHQISSTALRSPLASQAGAAAGPSHAGNAKPGSTIKEFILSKRPADNYERIACLVYYLEKVQNVEGVKTGDITQANSDARQPSWTNPTVFVNKAVSRYKFLTSIGGGKKALSARGEALVDALPDRVKVQEVLVSQPNTGSRKSSGKKKKKR